MKLFLLSVLVAFFLGSTCFAQSRQEIDSLKHELLITKLASLGELTAGIAHEIQNPLNFVNNFSELSVELIEELKSSLTPKGGIEEEELLSDISQNLGKINLHGKRASSIVKGMLEHSRQSTGERTLTNINQLADEYLRLAYHGLRAKDNTFNADYELITDDSLPKIDIIPQDIGRVILNLVNNAFYAVQQPKNLSRLKPYQPKVKVSTQKIPSSEGASGPGAAGGWVEIRVQDNGTGMSEATKAKIFQPFLPPNPRAKVRVWG